MDHLEVEEGLQNERSSVDQRGGERARKGEMKDGGTLGAAWEALYRLLGRVRSSMAVVRVRLVPKERRSITAASISRKRNRRKRAGA